MTSTPTISISGTSISNQVMTKIIGGSGLGSHTLLGADIDGEAGNDNSGRSVSFSSDGSRVAIGAPVNGGNGSASGHVRIYDYNGSAWTQLGPDIDGEAAGDQSGWSVSLSSDGSRVAIGGYLNGDGSNSGHVRVFKYQVISGTATWTQLGLVIDGEVAGDNSGRSVSFSSDGSRVAIGAPGNDGNGSDSGHVRIYDYNGSAWTQLGTDIDGEAAGDLSGWSVSLSSDGSRVAIGAKDNAGNGSDSGHVRVFKYQVISGTATWTQLGLDIDGEAANDYSGESVSLSSDGSRVAIGARGNDDNGSNSGHVRIFSYTPSGVSSWTQVGIDIDGEAAGDLSGRSVSLSSDGSRVAIGASGNDENRSNSGHVRIYNYNGSAWVQVGADIDGEAENDGSGESVSLSSDGSRVAIGALANDDNGSNSGHVRVYSISSGETYQYVWDVDGGGIPSNGTYYATVAAADKAGNAYVAGTQSITFTLDTTAPTVTLTNTDNNNKVNTSSVVTFTAVFSEALQGSPTITIPGIVTDTPLTLVSGTTWKYTWDTSSGTLAEGSHTVSITGQDSAGNSATVTSTFVVDTTVPTLSGLTNNDGNNTLNGTDTVTITATFNEPMNNSPTITIGNGVTDVAMTATSSTVWTYFLDMSSWSGSGSSAVVTVTGFDGAENSYAGTDSFTFYIDSTAPTVTAITAISSSGTYVDDDANPSNSDTINIKVTFSEPVTITGSPTIKLNTDPTRYATYVSGSGTSTPTFAYQVQDGDNVDALGKASDASSITLNGGSISDGANDANLAINSVAFTPSIAVRAKDPMIQYVTIESNNATSGSAAKAGDVITITLAPDAIGGINTSLVTFTLTGFSPQPSLTFTATGTGLYTASFTLDSSATFNQGGVNYSMYLSDTQSSSSITSVNINASAFDNSSLASAFTIDTVTPTITSLSSLNITEGQTTGPAVTTNETTQYSIVGGADQSKVTINPNTGAISFGTAPDYANPDDADTDGIYEVIVQVNDVVGATVTQTIQITTQEVPYGIEFTPVNTDPVVEGESKDFTAVLTSPPTQAVTIPFTLTNINGLNGSFAPQSLTFTPQNWNVPQKVSINTNDNGSADGDITVTLETGIPNSTDPNYSGLTASDLPDITFTLKDNEADTDGDGFQDAVDVFPNDPNEYIDTDGDGIGNNADTDDDGDGQSDELEITNGTDPLVANPAPGDSDGDGLPDIIDPDDDNDGVIDSLDVFPLDANESSDNDGDGLGDNADTDDDNDGYSDTNETAAGSDPLDPSSIPEDSDNDKLPDSLEPGLGTDPNNPDTDGDGTIDGEDDFPTDPNYQTDTDGDGIPNKTDPDDDNDGLLDEDDPYPLDPNNQPDTDGDGLNDGIDPDDDNDGFTDLQEEAAGTDPLNPNSIPRDRDNDGLSDVEEAELGTDPENPDTDGDGVSDKFDSAPLDPNVGS